MDPDLKHCVLLAILLCFTALSDSAASANELSLTVGDAQQALDKYTSEVESNSESETGPGCVAGIARDGELLASAVFGMANLEHRIPMTTEMVFDIGSTSKQFTAISAAMLARAGRLDLDADIRTYLPDMPVLDTPISVRHLIHHSSGLPDVYQPLSWLYNDAYGNRYPSELTLTMARGIRRLEFVPGSRYEYSNLGYLLLAEIVESVSGQTLREFVEENIFAPMEMTNTHLHDDIGEMVPNRASAYSWSPKRQRWEWQHSDFNVMGDGGVYSTLGDMAKWYNVYKDPSPLDGGHELLEMLLTSGEYTESGPRYLDRPMDYGYGVQIIRDGDHYMIGHPGGWAGYASVPYYLPDLDVAAISLCNVQKRENFRSFMQMIDALHRNDD